MIALNFSVRLSNAPDYKAVPLFGAAYKTGVDSALKHICDVSRDPLEALCRRPKSDHLMDDAAVWEDPGNATCATCLSRWRAKR